MNKMFEEIDKLDSIVSEGYSLGDDKESFDVWEEESEKLNEIMNYIKDNCGVDFSNIEVEHSQDNIFTADITIKGLPESAINDDIESELYNKYCSGYNNLFDNIQLETWYGPCCLLGFNIDRMGSRKYKLGSAIKDIQDRLMNSGSLKEDDSSLVCRVDMPISVAKGSVNIDSETSYSTVNAKTIFTDKKVYYSNNIPVEDEDFIKGGPWWMPRFSHNIKLYNDKECTDFVGSLSDVHDKIYDELRDKYPDDYWEGISYNRSVGAQFYNADTGDVVWVGEDY